MIARLIRWSIGQRVLVLIATVIITASIWVIDLGIASALQFFYSFFK